MNRTGSGAALHYFEQGVPPGLLLNPWTGAITGTPAIGDGAYGPYTVTVIATDGTSFAQETFIWKKTKVSEKNKGVRTRNGSYLNLRLTLGEYTHAFQASHAAHASRLFGRSHRLPHGSQGRSRHTTALPNACARAWLHQGRCP